VRKPQVSKGVRTLKPEEASYIAGFIDGEGWIGLMLKKEPVRKRKRMQPIIHVSNTNKSCLLWLRDTIGYGSTVNHNLRRAKSKHKRAYRYVMLNKKQILKLLGQLLPYLRLKRKQAKLVMRFCQRKNRSTLTESDYVLYRKLRKLNQRGVNGK